DSVSVGSVSSYTFTNVQANHTISATFGSCPSSFTVNDNGDAGDANPGDGICATAGSVCTLRAAIQEANALASCGAININFSGVTSPINLGSALPFIAHNVNINGPGANLLTVQRSSASDFRIFTINSGKTVVISGLTISNGNIAGAGGGIFNGGTLTLTSSTVSGNTASRGGGGSYNGDTLTLTGSTVSGNNASQGGGLMNDTGGTLTLTNSTMSGNTASGNGGGILNGDTLTLTNVTITNNHSDFDDSGGEQGGGVFNNAGSIVLRNTIVAGNFIGSGTNT